ncbi:tetratricopeptide repeat protein [Paraglaciecola sp. 25GB23A]|uniref:tetratricopeptide repeat protein n=1 Tax=Paraglaciecola sp. 25GB23A TaxID=3156068 RepID=UPI0032AF9DA2
MDCQPSPQFERKYLFALGLMFTLLLPNAFATSSTIPQEITALLNQQKTEQAFSLAAENQANLEGEPDFDLAFGIAAKATNNCNLAVYALERVVQILPQKVVARYALAGCYFELGNFAAAKIEFNQLAQQNLSAEMQSIVEQHLNVIERSQERNTAGWHNAIELVVGQDSNPNNGVENEFIDVPLLGQVKLFEQSQAHSSSFYDLNGQFSYIAPLDQRSAWFSSLGVSHSEYSHELAQSRSNLNAVLGYTTKMVGKDISARLFYRPLWLDQEAFLDYYGVVAEVGQGVLNQSAVGAELTLARLDYSDLDELSRNQHWLNLWFETPTFSGVSRLSIKLGDEQSQDKAVDFNSRRLLGASYSFAQQLDVSWYYKISLDYLKAEHEQTHPLFLLTREDKYVQLVFDLQYQWQANWLLTAQASVVNNHSNLSLYDYKRSNVWLGARYQF